MTEKTTDTETTVVESLSLEPIIGHHVGVELEETEYTPLHELTNPGEPETETRERAIITVGDVDWDSTQTVKIQRQSLERIAKWYLNVVGEMEE